uniref:solute carrier family 35 member F6-like isoform X2 n=1 Tax=Styela clava TaxID=7725 RepID=UPI00193A2F25|nr:solute carrier family 35 member F6-like isoform X2 [Styela clava]
MDFKRIPYRLTIAIGMVVTGSINTLVTKWTDRQSVPGCKDGKNPELHEFDHPFLQTVVMFIGEFSLLIVFKIIWRWRTYRGKETEDLGNQNFNPLLLFIPAFCDMIGTSLIYIGLTYTYASSTTMFSGSIIIFTALLSVAFLRRVVKIPQWIGIGCVIVGLIIVGLSDVLFPDKGGDITYGRNEIITGDLLIVIAQIIHAIQVVVEENYVTARNINPMQVVGWEGFFGMTTLGFLLIPMYFIETGHDSDVISRLEDPLDGLCQIVSNWKMALATFGTIVSIGLFNFNAMSVTRELSATTRMVLGSINTAAVWLVSLCLLWEEFQYLQIIGFIVLLLGTSLYVIPFHQIFNNYGVL